MKNCTDCHYNCIKTTIGKRHNRMIENFKTYYYMNNAKFMNDVGLYTDSISLYLEESIHLFFYEEYSFYP